MGAWEAKPGWMRAVLYVLMATGFVAWFGGTITGQAENVKTVGKGLFFVAFSIPLVVITRAQRH